MFDPDWATAIFTGLIVLVTGVGSGAAWLLYRMQRRERRPVAEIDAEWSDEGFVHLLTVLHNRALEPVQVRSVKVLSPRGTKLATVTSRSFVERPRGRPSRIISMSYSEQRDIWPLDFRIESAQSRSARLSLDLCAFPPPEWSGGPFSISFEIVSRSDATRRSTTIAKAIVAPRTQSSADDNASSQA